MSNACGMPTLEVVINGGRTTVEPGLSRDKDTPRRATALGTYYHGVRPALGGIPDGVFWSSAALNRAQATRHSLVPFAHLGILEKVDKGTRNNHAASYRMPDREGVKQALAEAGVDLDATLPGDYLRFAQQEESELKLRDPPLPPSF